MFGLWLGNHRCRGMTVWNASFYVTLCRGRENPWIWVSSGVLEPIPLGNKGTTEVLGESEVTCGFSPAWVGGGVSNHHVVQGSTPLLMGLLSCSTHYFLSIYQLIQRVTNIPVGIHSVA